MADTEDDLYDDFEDDLDSADLDLWDDEDLDFEEYVDSPEIPTVPSSSGVELPSSPLQKQEKQITPPFVDNVPRNVTVKRAPAPKAHQTSLFSIFVMIFLLLFLGGGGYGLYHLMSSNGARLTLPVVKIYSAVIDDTLEASGQIISQEGVLAVASDDTIQQPKRLESALTPFPADLDSSSPVLADLDGYDATQPAAETNELFAEEQLISKTELPFDLDTSSDAPAQGTIDMRLNDGLSPSYGVNESEQSIEPLSAEVLAIELAALEGSPVPKKKPEHILKQQKQLIIRAAQPGKALLYDTVTGKMNSVEVGDQSGELGTIRSISFVEGKWLVVGSLKTLSQ